MDELTQTHIQKYGMRVFGLCVVLIAFGSQTALADGILDPLGPVTAHQKNHLLWVIILTMIAVLPVLIGIPLIVFRYRRKASHNYQPNWEHSTRLEILMWGVPFILLVFLGIALVRNEEYLDPYRAIENGSDPVKIQVVGLNWKWLFIYPQNNAASVGTLAIPAGRPVELSITTDSVMQSFFVPQLAGQIYAMPGMVSKLNLMADDVGETTGLNSQYNGEGFAEQIIEVKILSDEDWHSWLDDAANAPALDAANYAILAKPSTTEDAQNELALDDGRMALGVADLFNNVVMRYHQGEAIVSASQPGSPDFDAEEFQCCNEGNSQ